MHWQQLLSSSVLAATAVSAHRSPRHVGTFVDKLERAQRNYPGLETRAFEFNEFVERADSDPLFLNKNTTKFAVNGTGIPDVDFDIGESYAGQLPITDDPDGKDNLFFWFFPSTNPSAEKEILIWLNGGPGCSSFEGLLQENGPFLWQYGTFKPYSNPYSWNKLTNVVYIEQPVGTGFSEGTPTATSEDDIASQFMGFWKNFVDTFGMQGYTVYIAGESYAGAYCPYIANGFLDANDTTYFNMSGVLIYDPVITYDPIQEQIVTLPFVDYFKPLFPFNDTFWADLRARDESCGYSDYVNKYLVYPPSGPQPPPDQLPGLDSNGTSRPECDSIYWDAFEAILLINPCFDIYQVATTCPMLWDVLGFPGSQTYLPQGASIYFDREDVKKAINAPNITWEECSSDDVFVDGTDTSPPSGITVLPSVIERTNNVIIGHGALDMILIANGTLLGIQNMTWGGQMGFQSAPTEPFFVPYHDEPQLETLAGSGVFGTVHTERGLTYVAVDLSGHMVPQYAPTAAYRHLEFLLGRVSSMSGTDAFTTNTNVTQPTGDLGNGTAPQGWASAATNGSDGGSCSGGSSNSTDTNAGSFLAPSALVAMLPVALMAAIGF